MLALGLIVVVTLMAENDVIGALAGTTGLLLLCVFAVVNIACIVLRRDAGAAEAFRAPELVPAIGAVACLFLVGPWARDSEDYIQYQIAGGLLALGIVLWLLTMAINRATGQGNGKFEDVTKLER